MSNLTYVTLLVGTIAFAGISCKETNPNYCAGNPEDNCREMWDAAGTKGDTSTACTGNSSCTSAADPVCDTSLGHCVQCLGSDDQACTGTTPTCGSNDECQACVNHTDCASDACLPTGACGDDTNVAYVDPAGTNNSTCTKLMPCSDVMKALATNRPYVKFHGTTDEAVTVHGGQVVTFLADPGAELTRGTGGAILTVSDDDTALTVYDLSISNAPNNTSGYGVVIPAASGAPSVSLNRVMIANDPGGGISASGGSLSVMQSTISSNTGGGILVSGTGSTFNIANNFIIYNGVAAGINASQLGGVALTSNNTGSTFQFNTVAFNSCDGSIYRGGVICTGSNVTAPGNLVYKNTEGGTTSAATQTGGACQFGNTLAVVMDTANLGFKSPINNPLNFHLTAASPSTVVDAAGACGATDPVDVDGDTRPQGTACDFGADEYKP